MFQTAQETKEGEQFITVAMDSNVSEHIDSIEKQGARSDYIIKSANGDADASLFKNSEMKSIRRHTRELSELDCKKDGK